MVFCTAVLQNTKNSLTLLVHVNIAVLKLSQLKIFFSCNNILENLCLVPFYDVYLEVSEQTM